MSLPRTVVTSHCPCYCNLLMPCSTGSRAQQTKHTLVCRLPAATTGRSFFHERDREAATLKRGACDSSIKICIEQDRGSWR